LARKNGRSRVGANRPENPGKPRTNENDFAFAVRLRTVKYVFAATNYVIGFSEFGWGGAVQEGYLAKFFSERDYLLEPAAAKRLCELPDGEAMQAAEASVQFLSQRGGFVLTRPLLEAILEDLASARKAAQPALVQKTGFDAAAKRMPSNLSFKEDRDVTLKSTCTGSLEDFVSYFNDRLTQERGFLRNRQTQLTYATIQKLKSSDDRKTVRVIGMVSDKRHTKNGHVLVEFEDESGSMPCLFSKNDKGALELANQLLLDEVIALDGFKSGELFIVKDASWPELPIRERRLADSDACIAFISDLHVGSKFFMGENFENFLKFLNGDGPEEELAGRIKYLLIAGDITDGIGVYPRQEAQLVTKDIFEQYEVFAKLMEAVPDWVEVVISPGNHDAVRIAEPQPRLPKEFTKSLENKKNFHFVGNPAYVEVEGLSVLMYHGTSLDALVAALPSLRSGYQSPEKVGEEMLRRRHLCPIYGEKPIVPEKKDYMVIDFVPDLFHFGHVHKNGYSNYRGTTIINSGTWQSTTDYQLRQGHVPTPCQLPVYEVRTGALRVLDFK